MPMSVQQRRGVRRQGRLPSSGDRKRLPDIPAHRWHLERTDHPGAHRGRSGGRRRGGPRPRGILMRALVQTVSRAGVTVGDEVVGEIEDGLLVLLGVAQGDTPATAAELARKTYELRILDDEASAADLGAPLLVVSQFTLYGDAPQGAPAELECGRAGRDRRAAGHRVRRGAACPRRDGGDRPFPGAHAGGERERRPADHPAGALARSELRPGRARRGLEASRGAGRTAAASRPAGPPSRPARPSRSRHRSCRTPRGPG